MLINRSREDVFAYVGDIHNDTRWQAGVKAVRYEGPPGEGMRIIQVRVVLGKRVETVAVCTRFAPPQTIAFTSDSSEVTFAGSYAFASVGERTRVTFSMEVQMDRVPRLLRGVIAGRIQREAATSLTTLKQVLETA